MFLDVTGVHCDFCSVAGCIPQCYIHDLDYPCHELMSNWLGERDFSCIHLVK